MLRFCHGSGAYLVFWLSFIFYSYPNIIIPWQPWCWRWNMYWLKVRFRCFFLFLLSSNRRKFRSALSGILHVKFALWITQSNGIWYGHIWPLCDKDTTKNEAHTHRCYLWVYLVSTFISFVKYLNCNVWSEYLQKLIKSMELLSSLAHTLAIFKYQTMG